MKSLIAAVLAALENDSSLKSLAPGGVHAGRAPAGTGMPFVVVTYRGAARGECDTAGTTVSPARMEFEIFAPGASAAADAAQRVLAVFESSPPLLETGACLSAAAVTDSLRIEAGAGGEGEDVWRAAVEIEFLIERPAP